MIEIAGNIMEGGGQILRNASALSCILQKPIRIANIRANRSKPGLRPQHLCGFKLIGEMCTADICGDEVNSCTVELSPSPTICGGSYTKEVGTAGSLVLLLQSSLPVALFSTHSCDMTLGGGTNAENAPPIDYFMQVFQPMAARMGIQLECHLLKRGFYPKGCGRVRLNVQPVTNLKPITWVERGELTKISGVAYAAGQVPIKVAERMAKQAEVSLKKNLPQSVPITIERKYESPHEAFASGCGIFLTAHTSTGCVFGGTGVGRKGKPAEEVANDATTELLKAVLELGCVDEHLQDQLVIFMALAKGKSTVKSGPLTLHTETAIDIAQKLTGVKFCTDPQEDGTILMSCDGIGHTNPNL